MEKSKQEEVQTRDVFELVTNQIITLLEKGVIPWKQTWAEAGLPQNLITRKPYRGVNLLLLASAGYNSNFFLTFKQLKELGASVKKGEKSHLVIFWKKDEKEKQHTDEKTKMFLRHYRVFNVSQCTGIPEIRIPEIGIANDPVAECERIIEEMPHCPDILINGNPPAYHPVEDFIAMPSIKKFKSSEAFYDALFHEMVHSTGHQSRLNRKEVTDPINFGSESYSIEELTAEFGACYLKSYACLKHTTLDNNAAYIQGWLKKLKDDKRFIVFASAQAQRAVDFILNVTFQPKEVLSAEEVNS